MKYNKSKVVIGSILCMGLFACRPNAKPVNISSEMIDKAINDFTVIRANHYLRSAKSLSNSDLLAQALDRQSLKLHEFIPAFRRFYPELSEKLLGIKKSETKKVK